MNQAASLDLVNIAAHLPRMARENPHQLGVVFPHGRDAAGRVAYTHYTFRQLEEACNLVATGLIAAGVTRGCRTVLMVKPSLDFFALTFALFKLGAVPVMVDPGMGVRSLKKCLQEAEPEVFIGITKAHVARLILGWPSMRLTITVGRRLFWGGLTLQDVIKKGSPHFTPADTRRDEMAAILFTSGSTGVPKGAVYTHGTFDSQVTILRKTYDIRPGEVDLATFPLFALFAPALGMTALVPDMDFTRPALVDPHKIIEAVENFGVTNMFGSPALLDRVGRHGVEHGVRLPSLKRVISAGAPVQPVILERMSRMLADDVEIHTPYGATESLPVATIGSAEILGETGTETHHGKGVCVGKPVPEIQVFIIRIDDEPIEKWDDRLLVPDGEIGELVVRGPMVTERYFNRDSSTRLAKMRDDQGRIYHRMGDLGYRDQQGRLWFCGRKTHRVISGETTYYTVAVEGVFNAHPGVYRSALVGVGPEGRKKPILCVELEKNARDRDKDELRGELLALGKGFDHTRAIDTILFHQAFPVDIRHNAKIFREKLAVWAEGKL